MKMLCKVAKQSCQVEELFVHEPPAFSESTDGEIEEEFDANIRQHFENVVRKLLHSSRNSLISISINGGYSLAELSHAPLTKLLKLKMENLYHATVEEFWDSISSVDYSRVAPQLHRRWRSTCVH